MRSQEITHDKENDIFYFKCPHCSLLCEVPRNEIRCTIFRHANFIHNMSFVPPHASKEECDRWIEENLVYGCGKPFIFDGETVKKCEYI